MTSRIWIGLFIAFSVYSGMIYTHCDDNNKEGTPGKDVVAGWKIWQEKNCQSCHQLYGLGGYLGPDLTNVASEPKKGIKYMETFIKYGTGRMPNYHLNDSDTHNIISFLAWVDKSGMSLLPPETVHWSGTYKLDK